MPVTPLRGARGSVRVVWLVAIVAGLMLAADAVHIAIAQTSPFGVGRAPTAAPPPPAADGVVGWILAKQAEFYRGLSGLIRAAKADGSAVWGLFGLSFLYGVFHAAGPGHGKAVISSYLVANEETWRRGVVLSFASALLQALVAVAIVGIAAVLLNATAKTMGDAVRWIEIVSYALIAAVGARLLLVKGRAFLSALHAVIAPRPALAAAGEMVVPVHDHHHDDHHHHHDHHHDHGDAHHHHDHSHRHGDDDASAWGHAHAPEPEQLAGPGGWQRGLSAIVAVGLRPCSGAILVLVFALAQGIFWAGVGATFVMGLGTAVTVAAIATLAVGAKAIAAKFAETRSGYGSLALRGLEVGAAVLVLAFGILLLMGYMASERMFAV
jgi:nickel/cobalt transporter (NicO) family protein